MLWFLLFIATFSVLAYHRASLIIWTIAAILLLTVLTRFSGAALGVGLLWLGFVAVLTLLNVKVLRKRFLTGPIFSFYQSVLPVMSRTEREAISAGTVTWEGDLFRGNPDWRKLLAISPASLTKEEQAFIDGPVDVLCSMLNDWEITHHRMDLSPEVWTFVKENGFFGLIIPKRYGGKGFSAYAQSQIFVKVSGVSITASTTIAVPNSLGPAELLLHYGTESQREYYLPRLAKGEEVPCFALTSPVAGSDAGAMTDHGVVCQQVFNGQPVLGSTDVFISTNIMMMPTMTIFTFVM